MERRDARDNGRVPPSAQRRAVVLGVPVWCAVYVVSFLLASQLVQRVPFLGGEGEGLAVRVWLVQLLLAAIFGFALARTVVSRWGAGKVWLAVPIAALPLLLLNLLVPATSGAAAGWAFARVAVPTSAALLAVRARRGAASALAALRP